jgi:hypothetical protein
LDLSVEAQWEIVRLVQNSGTQPPGNGPNSATISQCLSKTAQLFVSYRTVETPRLDTCQKRNLIGSLAPVTFACGHQNRRSAAPF